MAARYPAVVFAPDGGATFVVYINPLVTSARLRTPMPATDANGRLAAPWRWGGHHIDMDARLVQFTFVNRLNEARWTQSISFESAQGQQ
jgi:hypothetical protein